MSVPEGVRPADQPAAEERLATVRFTIVPPVLNGMPWLPDNAADCSLGSAVVKTSQSPLCYARQIAPDSRVSG